MASIAERPRIEGVERRALAGQCEAPAVGGADERDDILAFLRSLTDEEFLKDPRFSDPLGP